MTLENKKHNKILNTNYLKIGMILSLTAVVSFLIWDQNESFAAVLFFDDFSSYPDQTSADNSWVPNDPTKVRVNIISDEWDIIAVRDGTNDAISHDLGTPVSDTDWILRYKLDIESIFKGDIITEYTTIGLFDTDQTVIGHPGIHDGIGIQLAYDTFGNSEIDAVSADGGSITSLVPDYEFLHPLQVEVIYVETKRTSATTYEVSLYSDDTFSTLIETSGSITIPSTIQNLQYIGSKNVANVIVSTNTATYRVDDVELNQEAFCNNLPATIEGTSGDDILIGTAGDDVIAGLGGDDIIYGLDGDDTICGGKGNDFVRAGSGDDFIRGDGGKDVLLGDEGNDEIRGNAGDDRLLGGSGEDTIKGGNGNDVLVGGTEDDDLNGNGGTDFCDISDPTDTISNCESTT